MYILIPFLCFFFMLPPSSQGEAEDLHARIVKAAEAVLSNRYAQSDPALEVRVVRTGGTIIDAKNLELVWPLQTEIPRALLRVNINSKDVDANVHKGWALLYVAHFDSAMVLNRSAKNDELLQEPDFSIIWTETTRFHGSPLTPELYRKLRSRGPIYSNRYLASERVLKVNDLRNSYDVETGQQVIMTYKRRGIVLEISCKSRNRGFEGDIIKIYSPDTQLMYKAQISGPQRATWIETLE